MIKYETYKLLHLIFILIFFANVGLLVNSSELIKKRSFKLLIGLVSLLILVAGMGLIARLGFKHGDPFPLWIYLKMGFWFVVNIFLFLMFKVKNQNFKFFFFLLSLIFGVSAIWVVLNKPL